MATEVEVRNFQSIEHAHFTVEGYTALVGRSNIGKSAIVRAVKSALTGASGTDFVRHGPNCARRLKSAKKCQCKSTVRIKREGFDLLWEKGDNDNRYTFNGQVCDSVGSGTPDFLLKAGYGPIKIGDEKELLQVADQFEAIFLLNRTGGVIADVLSDVAHLDRVNSAMRFVEKDRREAVSTRKVREQDVADLATRLQEFDALDDALARVKAVEDQLVEVGRKETRLKQIERFLEAGSARGAEIKRLLGVENVAIPDAVASLSSVDGLLRLTRWHERLVTLKEWWERVKPVESLVAPDAQPLKTDLAKFLVRAQFASKLEAMATSVQTLEDRATALDEEARKIRAEWDALGLCPTCEQPCRVQHLEPILQAV
jgi:hypothetical protein